MNDWSSNKPITTSSANVPTSSSGHYFDAASVPPDDSQGLLAYWRMLIRRKGTILAIVLLGGLGGLVVSMIERPIYRARVSMEVQDFNREFLDVGKIDPTRVNYEADSYLQTQIKMIQSDSLLDRVAAKMPSYGSLADTRKTAPTYSWIRMLFSLPQAKPETPRERELRRAFSSLKVRGSGMTRLIEVYCDSSNPKFAADFVNTLADEYRQQSLEVRWNSAEHVTDWLTEQLRGLKSNLEASEARLNAYTRSAGILSIAERDTLVGQRLSELQQELLRAQTDRVTKQSRYELVATSPADSLPEILDDGSLRDYQSKLVELRRQYAELTYSLTPEHPQVKRLEAQIAELKTSEKERRSNIIDRIRNDYETARRHQSLLENAYASQLKLDNEESGKYTEYNALKRDVDTTRELYDSMLHKFKEAGVAAAMRVSNIRVVDRAKIPETPDSPNRKFNVLLGSLMGLFLGTGFVFMREHIETNLNDPGETKLYLNIPELGLIPTIVSDPATTVNRRFGFRSLTTRNAGHEISGGSSELVPWSKNHSLTAESYRSTLTSILLWGEKDTGSRPQVILFTSPGPLDGKTSTVSNLGIAIAGIMEEQNRRVLLIDGDLRRPRLHKVFGFAENTGLCDLLRETRSPEECSLDLARRTDISGLWLLPSGIPNGPITNLLYSPRLGRLLGRLRREFDMILIDTPPMITLSDGRILGQWADAVVLVIRSGHTNRKAALVAREQLRDDGTPLLGTILTDWNPKKTKGAPNGFSSHYLRSYLHYYHHSNNG